MSGSTTLSASLASLRESTRNLNKLIENASNTVAKVEKYLSENCNLGIKACIPATSMDDDILYLAFGRHGQSWRILVQRRGSNDNVVDERPWAGCPRDVRIETVAMLPSLVRHMESLVAEKVTAVEEALSYLDSVPSDEA